MALATASAEWSATCAPDASVTAAISPLPRPAAQFTLTASAGTAPRSRRLIAASPVVRNEGGREVEDRVEQTRRQVVSTIVAESQGQAFSSATQAAASMW